MTSAYTEALKGLAKVINRVGDGYNFDAIRATVLDAPPSLWSVQMRARRASRVQQPAFMCADRIRP